MKTVVIFALLCLLYSATNSQPKRQNPNAAPFNERLFREQRTTSRQIHHSDPGITIPIPGTTSLGLGGPYQQQFANRGLHNIVVDPDHPNNLHAAVTFAQNITEADTVGGRNS